MINWHCCGLAYEHLCDKMGQFAVKQPPITLLQGKKLSAILDLAFLEWPKFVADVKVWADWLFSAFFAGELLYSGKWQGPDFLWRRKKFWKQQWMALIKKPFSRSREQKTGLVGRLVLRKLSICRNWFWLKLHFSVRHHTRQRTLTVGEGSLYIWSPIQLDWIWLKK